MATITWRKNRCYLNEVDYFGYVEEGSCEVKRKFIDIEALGLPATAKVPSGKFEVITAKLKFSNLPPSEIRNIMKDEGFVKLRLIGEARLLDTAQGLVESDEMQTTLRGFVENIPIPPTKSDKAEVEITIYALYIELKDKAGTVLLIDIPNGVVEPQEWAP